MSLEIVRRTASDCLCTCRIHLHHLMIPHVSSVYHTSCVHFQLHLHLSLFFVSDYSSCRQRPPPLVTSERETIPVACRYSRRSRGCSELSWLFDGGCTRFCENVGVLGWRWLDLMPFLEYVAEYFGALARLFLCSGQVVEVCF